MGPRPVRREEIISGYAASLTLGMGWSCTKPGVLVLPESGLTGDTVTRLREELAGQPSFPMLTERAGGEDLTAVAGVTDGQLTTTVHAEPDEDLGLGHWPRTTPGRSPGAWTAPGFEIPEAPLSPAACSRRGAHATGTATPSLPISDMTDPVALSARMSKPMRARRTRSMPSWALRSSRCRPEG